MGPGLTRGIKKGLRTIAQVAAGGALTALVTALAGGLAPTTQAIVMGAWIAFVAFSQNWAEGAGKIGVLLPTPALISGPTADAVATVEAAADRTGGIVGDVLDTAGDVVGEVTGQLDDDPERGGIPLALIIGIVIVLVLLGGLGVCGDALFEDEDERNDLGLVRVELVSHERKGT